MCDVHLCTPEYSQTVGQKRKRVKVFIECETEKLKMRKLNVKAAQEISVNVKKKRL